MKFKKSELEFLKVFIQVMDTKRVASDKLRIKTEKNKVTFSLFSEFGASIFTIDKAVSKDFEAIYPIQNFFNFVKLLKDDSEFEILDGKIKISDSEAEYQFDSFSIQLEDSKNYSDLLINKPKTTFVLKDVHNLKIAKSFAGKDDLNTVGLFNNSFVASDKTMACVIPTENKYSSELYLSVPLINIIQNIGTDEIELKIYEKDGKELVYFDMMGISIFSVIQNFTLPDLTSDDMKKMYDHPYKLIVKKDSLNDTLSRMKIFASLNVSSRVYLIVEKDKIKIENKEYNKSYEFVKAEVDKEIEGVSILLNCDLLHKLINMLEGTHVQIFVENDDSVAIKIVDEKADKVFIQVSCTAS